MLQNTTAKAIRNVDKFIGSDYEYILTIAENLEALQYVSDNMKEVVKAYINLLKDKTGNG